MSVQSMMDITTVKVEVAKEAKDNKTQYKTEKKEHTNPTPKKEKVINLKKLITLAELQGWDIVDEIDDW